MRGVPTRVDVFIFLKKVRWGDFPEFPEFINNRTSFVDLKNSFKYWKNVSPLFLPVCFSQYDD